MNRPSLCQGTTSAQHERRSTHPDNCHKLVGGWGPGEERERERGCCEEGDLGGEETDRAVHANLKPTLGRPHHVPGRHQLEAWGQLLEDRRPRWDEKLCTKDHGTGTGFPVNRIKQQPDS